MSRRPWLAHGLPGPIVLGAPTRSMAGRDNVAASTLWYTGTCLDPEYVGGTSSCAAAQALTWSAPTRLRATPVPPSSAVGWPQARVGAGREREVLPYCRSFGEAGATALSLRCWRSLLGGGDVSGLAPPVPGGPPDRAVCARDAHAAYGLAGGVGLAG